MFDLLHKQNRQQFQLYNNVVCSQVITKDANVMLVALGGRLLGALASGLRARFSPYACACVQAALEKFKERKPAVVAALREAVDAIYPCVSVCVCVRVRADMRACVRMYSACMHVCVRTFILHQHF